MSKRSLISLAVAFGILVGGHSGVAAAADGDPAGPECNKRVEVVFWTANRHRILMRELAANPAPCTDYWISVPAADNDKTMPRARGVYAEIRNLGPQFHPMAEVVLGTATGWASWVSNGNGSWYDAGVEMRRRMATLNLRLDLGETWLLNEFDRTTRLDSSIPGLPHAYTRTAMKELVRGLYEGAPGMQPLPGAVEIGVSFAHQNLPDVPTYKAEMRPYLQDAEFWTFLNGKVRWLLHEAYADTRNHGVPGSALEERRVHLQAYVFHLLELVKAGGRRTLAAQRFLQETIMPFVNGGGYAAPGGDEFGFVSGHGNTMVPLDDMMKFVSEQIYTVRHYAQQHRGEAPGTRIGFSWQPSNRFNLPLDEFEANAQAIAARLAEALRWSYGPGNEALGACITPGTILDWCTFERTGAMFVETWADFSSWH